MDNLVQNLFVFVLASFLGLEIIRRVSPLLHTPLMSLTNAISAVSIVGAILILGRNETPLSTTLGFIAVVACTINLVSGFLITERMIKMFKAKEGKGGPPAKAHVSILPLFLLGAAGSGAVSFGKNLYVDLAYLVSSVLFLLSLKWMNHPTTARKSVVAGASGMALGVVGTLIALQGDKYLPEGGQPAYLLVLGAVVLGSIIGYPISLVPMTAVPQRTALSHSFGGLAVGLIGAAKYFLAAGPNALPSHSEEFTGVTMAIIAFEVLLGLVTFTGSLIAFGKLAEYLPGRPIVYKGQNAVNFILLGIAIVSSVVLVAQTGQWPLFIVVAVLSLVFGVLLVIPIGGADMPTVISLLNSYAGLAASAMGFVLDNPLLIIAGALDGSSGLILSIIMCKAMNRSFTNVLFGAFGQVTAAAGKQEQKPVRSAGAEEAASILEAASKVVIVPGYGMAVAQAQHKVKELTDILNKKGVEVLFAIHPVAGRMPGHMNVLLAEADISYEKLIEMEDINPEMGQVDVALIIGANDVTNPAARTNPESPIYGMPILDVDRARTVMVIKRSMSSGFAGIDNELYYMDKTLMLFGDAKAFVGDIARELQSQH